MSLCFLDPMSETLIRLLLLLPLLLPVTVVPACGQSLPGFKTDVSRRSIINVEGCEPRGPSALADGGIGPC
ncbi:hypothetical protein AWN76_018210 [Rhodothermaceae bacterium RA]|nr:hypothetical protein AWN76_018210 [Rhodothermaceae bacterium RA]